MVRQSSYIIIDALLPTRPEWMEVVEALTDTQAVFITSDLYDCPLVFSMFSLSGACLTLLDLLTGSSALSCN